LYIQPIPWCGDSAKLFSVIADQPWAMWFDSSQLDRYDIMVADPIDAFIVDNAKHESPAWQRLQRMMEEYFPHSPDHRWPFVGGLAGYLEYGALSEFAACGGYQIGHYGWALIVDHHLHQIWLISAWPKQYGKDKLEKWRRLFTAASYSTHCVAASPFVVIKPPIANMTREAYRLAFDKLHAYLVAGDCYQVNLAQRFHAEVSGDPWLAYLAWRAISPAPWGGYLKLPGREILSRSPESLICLKHGHVVTRPIKGTRRRGVSTEEDQAMADELCQSPKDRAENVMIVDLLRNDLGRCCQTGSIKVSKLCQLNSYAQVHHLVSTIEGELNPAVTPLELLAAISPGGSITGAPKRRAMEIIAELEPDRRGVYCGSLFLLDYNQRMSANIAIRTATHEMGQLRYHAGGGVVYDSTWQNEYQECLIKAGHFYRWLQQIVPVATDDRL
jgi:para-aminobenzoate synthetase component I